MEQPKKPGATRDIADLKARLGLQKAVPAPMGSPQAPIPATPFGGAAPAQRAPMPPAMADAGNRGAAHAPMPMAPPPGHDPFASMRPPAGRSFDLRAIDDGAPVENVRARGGKSGIIIGIIVLLIGGAVGYGFGAAAVGRRAYNTANAAARKLKTELEDMQKTVTQIGTAVAMSQQRLAAAKQDPVAYDAQLIEDLEKVKLDPRPDTSRVFKVDYYRLEDLAVDRLMNYYYDSIALYNEVERHIKRTRADKEALEAHSTRQAQKGNINYGLVFDSRGKLVIGSLVEMGQPVCKGGTSECPADQIEGFQIRPNTGAPWSARKVGPKPAGDIVVPIERTPLFDAVMSGSPDSVRMEQYKQRYNGIRIVLARLAAEKKELWEAVEKASARADLFTL